MGPFRKNIIALMILSFVLVSGCRSGNMPTYHISSDIDFSFYKTVAVLPMDNLTNDKYAGEIIRQVVISELLASGLVDVSFPGEVKNAINELGIKAVPSISTEQVKALGKALKVEAVILGSVEEYGEVKMGSVSAPQVTITLMMADTGTGAIVWSVTKTRGGASFWARHFGASHKTISETTLLLVRDAIRTLAR